LSEARNLVVQQIGYSCNPLQPIVLPQFSRERIICLFVCFVFVLFLSLSLSSASLSSSVNDGEQIQISSEKNHSSDYSLDIRALDRAVLQNNGILIRKLQK